MESNPLKLAIFLAVGSLVMTSCEKAKDMASKAKDAVADRVEEVKGDFVEAKPNAPDVTLQSLVDQNGEGYLFRKDLPFPSRVKVKTRSSVRFKGRHFQASLLGQGSGVVDGEFKEEHEISRSGSVVSMTLSESVFIPTGAGNEEQPPEDRKKVIRRSTSLKMERKGEAWVRAGKDIDFLAASVVTGKNLGKTLTEDGLLPRPFWFGQRRLKTGDEVVLAGGHLSMLGLSGAKGEIRLKFESVEPYDGHPCGVFLVSGSVDDGALGHMGEPGDIGQFTIESGKVWLSLIHPIVLKEEIAAVITSKTGNGKALSSHTQGSAAILVEREWRVVPDDTP